MIRSGRKLDLKNTTNDLQRPNNKKYLYTHAYAHAVLSKLQTRQPNEIKTAQFISFMHNALHYMVWGIYFTCQITNNCIARSNAAICELTISQQPIL